MTIWGANLYVPRGEAATYLNDTVFQLARDMGITHLLIWQYNFNERARTVTRAQFVDAVSRMKDFGLHPIIDLEYNVAEATALVQALGSDCMMYEVCKEPHIAGTPCQCDATTYANHWNEVVNACRPINPNAMFGGPAVGSMPNTNPRSETWMREWLRRCDGDFVSVHSFEKSRAITTQAEVIARARTDHIEDITFLKSLMTEYGKNLPIVFSEIQWTAYTSVPRWDNDENFMRSWTQNLMSTFQEQNVYAAFFWVFLGYDNVFAIIRPPAQNYERKPQYYAIQEYIGGIPFTVRKI